MASPATARAAAKPLAGPDALEVENLDVVYQVRGKDRQVLSGLSFRIGRGEAYGLVGESGCGKSTAALAAVRYLPRNGRISAGRIHVDGRDLLAMGSGDLRSLRAKSVSMVYQDPGRALNPSIRVGNQLAEVFEFAGLPRKESLDRSVAMLERVRIVDPRRVMERYPHQLSGGMQQRVSIAMALATNPALLILDEPTTGLDVTVEAEVLDLVEQLRGEFSTSILFISHNLAVVARVCERVGVLYAGKLVEEGPTQSVFNDPRHPYSVGLLRCLPRRGRRKDHGRLDTIPGFLPLPGSVLQGCIFADRCGLADDHCRTVEPALIDLGGRASRCHYHDRAPDLPRVMAADAPAAAKLSAGAKPILAIRNLSKTFESGGHKVAALRDVNLDLMPGETLGLVGESGSGKTTLARLLLGLTPPDKGGSITLDGDALPAALVGRSSKQVKQLQIVFQNPDSALNRSHTVRGLIGRAITKLAGIRGGDVVVRLLELTRVVRLADRYLTAKPRQLSGGLKQRVAIARAFAGDPRVVVCDEPTSALDVSVQAAILNLLADLQAMQGVSYVFISHDLGVVRYLADRIAVLYLGRLMQVGTAEQVFAGPYHPYTEALLSAIPTLDGRQPERIRLTGEIPSAINPPKGCVFHTRCPHKIGAICEAEEPPLTEIGRDDFVRCHIPVAELPRAQPSA
ncbi:ABC transporter ATP-binding protein [Hypericibacter sp.]|uniref:ABC transporter ATP-binding protein n=1 Tax=Hypericibacter sp. TaxID=2705401 RepID=UPI003D6CD423